MFNTRSIVMMVSVATAALGEGTVSGQNYPIKPIRIVTSPAGGGGDFTARLIAQGISGPLGQPVIVENRPSSGLIQGDFLTKAPPDGYGLVVAGGSLWTYPLFQKAPYDVLMDFSPITLTDRQVNVLAVHPSMPVKSVKELIALAKARPGHLNFASSSVGSPSYLAAELFKSMAGVNIVNVPYSGTPAAFIAILTGEAQVTVLSFTLLMPNHKSGKVRALAVTSADPSVLTPGLPTMAAAGLVGYEAVSMTGMFGPGKMPAAILNRLNQEVVRVLSRTDVKEQFLNSGIEAVGSSPNEFATAIKVETARLGKVIKDSGIKTN